MADLACKVVVSGRKDSKHIPRPVHLVTGHRRTLWYMDVPVALLGALITWKFTLCARTGLVIYRLSVGVVIGDREAYVSKFSLIRQMVVALMPGQGQVS
jgi:hypothetical protein